MEVVEQVNTVVPVLLLMPAVGAGFTVAVTAVRVAAKQPEVVLRACA